MYETNFNKNCFVFKTVFFLFENKRNNQCMDCIFNQCADNFVQAALLSEKNLLLKKNENINMKSRQQCIA